MTERKLASIVTILAIKPIPGADRIEAVQVKGWWVVAQKGEYVVGSLAVYCEIDSFIPTNLAPFLSKGKEPREFKGIKGERLRTTKLKKQVSQGLLLPLSVLDMVASLLMEGLDVTDLLGIIKWEMPIPAQLAGKMKGNFPSFLRKTAQERVQNINLTNMANMDFEATEKLHGSSMTIYHKDGEWGVCSRNIDLKLEDEGNAFVAQFLSIRTLGGPSNINIAFQGELIGEGINGNQYGLVGTELYIFDIFDIDTQEYVTSTLRRTLCEELGLNHVPVISSRTQVTIVQEDLLELANFKSAINGSQAEGIVYKALDGTRSFKTISNSWLLKNE